MITTHLNGAVWLLPFSIGLVGIAWFIPIIAGAVASYFANRAAGGGRNSGSGGPQVAPGVDPTGAQGGYIFEQGSPYWPGSKPTIPSNWQQQATGQQGGGGGGGGGAQSMSQSRSVSDTSFENTVAPYILPKYQGLEGSLLGEVQGRLAQPYSLPRGYQALGLSTINEGFDLTNQSLENRLASSGLSGSPMAAAAYGGSERERAKALSGFSNELPLIERDARTQDLNLASAILQSFGRGQKSSGSQRTVTNATSSSTSSGGGGGGGPAIQTPMLGDALLQQYLAGAGGQKSGSSWLQNALGYAAIIAGIYATLKRNPEEREE